jgi:SulP family sulfate permease
MVGYKLAKPSLFKEMYKLGWDQFMPFTATVIAILFSDLLKGITIGILFGIFYTLRQSYRNTFQSINITKDEFGNETHHIVMAEEISFFNKAKLIETLDSIPHGSLVIIDCTKSKSIEYDVRDVIKNFESNAKTKNIRIEKINLNL